jgi:chromosome segregation ATPase
MDDNSIAPTVPDVPGTPPPAPTSTQQTGEDYEKRFKGLQRAYDALQKKLDEATRERDDLSTARETLTQDQKQVVDRLAKLESDLNSIKAERDGLQTQLGTHEAQLKRTRLIMSEYSDLAPFEAQGLLPYAETEEAQKELFEKFRTTIQTSVDAGVKQKVQGTGPSPTSPQSPPKRSAEQIYTRLTQLAGKTDDQSRQEYKVLIAEWDKLQEKP